MLMTLASLCINICMARIVTPTNLEAYVGEIIQIKNSNKCWMVTGKTAPDNSIQNVEVVGTKLSTDCYDAVVQAIAQNIKPTNTKQKVEIFP